MQNFNEKNEIVSYSFRCVRQLYKQDRLSVEGRPPANSLHTEAFLLL